MVNNKYKGVFSPDEEVDANLIGRTQAVLNTLESADIAINNHSIGDSFFREWVRDYIKTTRLELRKAGE